MNWEMTGPLVAVLAPLVGVPLSAMTFYLRAMHDGQESRDRELIRRIETIEGHMRSLEEQLEGVLRDYTTKEEWLRESMLARQQLQRLTEMAVRATVVEGGA